MPQRSGRARLPAGPRDPRVPDVRLPLPRARRHPRDADRRGREARDRSNRPQARGQEEEQVTVLDDPAALRAADPGGMLDIVTHLADQCREGYALGLAASPLPEPDG